MNHFEEALDRVLMDLEKELETQYQNSLMKGKKCQYCGGPVD